MRIGAQTRPMIPASAPDAKSHSGCNDVRRTSATVTSVMTYPRQSWFTARSRIVALANISPIVIGVKPRRIARPIGALG
jgi:hypothetical protein